MSCRLISVNHVLCTVALVSLNWFLVINKIRPCLLQLIYPFFINTIYPLVSSGLICPLTLNQKVLDEVLIPLFINQN
jgi:hypothetical protein